MGIKIINLNTFKDFPLNKKMAYLKLLDKEYYTGNESPVDDYIYDQMKDIVLKENPEYKTIGSKAESTFNEVRHDFPMLSMDKASANKDDEKNKKALEKILNLCNKTKGMVVDLKIDGLSVSLKYKNGKLIQAATRGDGTIGEDITENVKTIKDVPLNIDYLDEIEIRGEAYVELSTFEEINKNLLIKFKNARNYASGSLRQKDPSITYDRKLSFFAFSIIGGDISNYKKEKEMLKKLGFNTPYSFTFAPKDFNIDNLNKITNHFLKMRKDLDFLIDGIIFKAFYFSDREELGENEKYPKWAMAWKFLPLERQTKILGIDWTVGKTGVITPCAIIEPIELDGSTISHPTLHNRKNIEKLELKIGATVVVSKAGDVIPQVIKSIGGDKEVEIPTHCPSCKSKLVYEDVFIRCINNKCPEKLLGQLQTMADAMGIEEFGEATRKLVVEAGYIKNVFDMFKLKKEQILKLEGFKEKSANKLIENIEKADKTPVKLLTGIVITGVSKGTFEKLLTMNNFHGLIEDIRVGDLEKYRELEGIGDFVINSLMEYGKDYAHLLDELVYFYDNYGTEVSSKFNGLSFAITGSLEGGRKNIENIIELNGGKVGGITKNTTYLICNNPSNSSKFQKAQKYGIKVISEEEFNTLLN